MPILPDIPLEYYELFEKKIYETEKEIEMYMYRPPKEALDKLITMDIECMQDIVTRKKTSCSPEESLRVELKGQYIAESKNFAAFRTNDLFCYLGFFFNNDFHHVHNNFTMPCKSMDISNIIDIARDNVVHESDGEYVKLSFLHRGFIPIECNHYLNPKYIDMIYVNILQKLSYENLISFDIIFFKDRGYPKRDCELSNKHCTSRILWQMEKEFEENFPHPSYSSTFIPGTFSPYQIQPLYFKFYDELRKLIQCLEVGNNNSEHITGKTASKYIISKTKDVILNQIKETEKKYKCKFYNNWRFDIFLCGKYEDPDGLVEFPEEIFIPNGWNK